MAFQKMNWSGKALQLCMREPFTHRSCVQDHDVAHFFFSFFLFYCAVLVINDSKLMGVFFPHV